jgi:bis(5'-adenosyl)-triphosphatase
VQISIQDGEDAGQTVDHCHIHIIPVTKNFNFNEHIDDFNRPERSSEDRDKEAEIYRESFVLN